MANITKIKAHDTREKSEKKEKSKESPVAEQNVVKNTTSDAKQVKSDKKQAKKAQKLEKKAKKAEKRAGKKPFILFRPFIAFGCYLRDSWKEIRQIRWPSRKATWKMFFAVVVYAALFMLLVTALDALFTFLSNLLIA